MYPVCFFDFVGVVGGSTSNLEVGKGGLRMPWGGVNRQFGRGISSTIQATKINEHEPIKHKQHGHGPLEAVEEDPAAKPKETHLGVSRKLCVP